MDADITRGTAEDIDSLEPLWASMVEHHRAVAGDDWPVKTAAAAWAIRREQYVGWLGEGSGTLFLARVDGGTQPVGYALVRWMVPGATWELGDEVGELESLAVAAESRGLGVGARLIAESRAELRRRGISYWTVAVVERNEHAVRLYEREGFEPYYRNMLGRVDG